jgi:hypothetical protein
MRILGSVLAVAALCLLLAGSASAVSTGQVQMSFTGNVSPGDGVNTSLGNTTAGVYQQKLYLDAGRHVDYVDGEASRLIDPFWANPLFVPGDDNNGRGHYATVATFCADFKQYVYTGVLVTYDIYAPEYAPVGLGNNPDGMGDTKAADLRKLWKQFSGYGLGTLDWGDWGSTPTATEQNEQAAAFQAAVWEIIYETNKVNDLFDYTVATGVFHVDSAETWTDLANTWLGSLGTIADPTNLGLRILTNGAYQDFAIIVPGVGADPIPEPVTMAGLMLGIGGLSGYIRRRRRA